MDRTDSATSLPGKDLRPARILLLRHGAAEGSAEGRFYGGTDVGLLARGEAQMREAAARAAAWLEEDSPPGVCTSPLRRARRSAEVLCDALGIALPAGGPESVAGFAELNLGEWEGETYASLHEKDPERLRAHYADFVRSRPPGGESLEDLARRVVPAWDSLRRRAAGGTVLAVAHAGVNRVILCEVLGVPLANFFRIEQDFAALNVIEFHGETPLLRLLNG